MPPKPKGQGRTRTSARGSKAPTPVGSNQGTPLPSQPQTPTHSRDVSPAPFPRPHTPDAPTTTPVYPVVLSPVKQRQHQNNKLVMNMLDLDVWEKPDSEIIEATFSGLTADTYNHYNISIERVYTNSVPEKFHFIFSCKVDPDNHKDHYRDRQKNHDGTGNLVTGLKQCNERLQKCALALDINENTIPYSEVAFRTLIALHCAASN
ncbi:hypothetical protein BDQ17DRAFT_1340083 [Cyathus striatus]|nr:hypothetical protein BDQ17DRAFT_1340083 [Cyathus striatus]